MNWKIILGVIIIIAGTSELFAIRNASRKASTNFNPLYAEIGCVVLILAGSYLIYKNRKKKTI